MKRADLLELFYELRKARTGQPVPDRINQTTSKALDRYIDWARNRGVNAEAFMRWRMEAAERVGYTLYLSGMTSDRHLKMWREWAGTKSAVKKQQAFIQGRVDPSAAQKLDLATKLLAQHEQYRRNMVDDGTPERCMKEPQYSGGYHPHSRFCPLCPMAIRCAVALNEAYGGDLVALRVARHPHPGKESAAKLANRV